MVADRAYATCLRLARQHYENFPVASRLLPRATRHHVAAVYAFARIADDFAAEGDRTEGDCLKGSAIREPRVASRPRREQLRRNQADHDPDQLANRPR